MNLEVLPQIAARHMGGNAADFEAQMQYWDEIANGPAAQLALWAVRSLKRLLGTRSAVGLIKRTARA